MGGRKTEVEIAVLTIRKARPADASVLCAVINHHAAQGGMLRRTLAEIRMHCSEFMVAELNGVIQGCGALKAYNADLAELRSLCTMPGVERRGVGRALTERLIRDAASRGFKTLFALTVVPEFFRKCGFREINRLALPLKIWRDCLHCRKFFRCDERAMVLDLLPRDSRPGASDGASQTRRAGPAIDRERDSEGAELLTLDA